MPTTEPTIEIVEGYAPGVLGRITTLHAQYYDRYWNFDLYFETKVAQDLSEFLQRYEQSRDGLWTLRLNGIIEGSLAIDGQHAMDEGAHLRWFIVSEALQGSGLGSKLLQTAITFCRQRDYPRIYLHTFDGLCAARRLYERNHFRLERQTRGKQWGTEVTEQLFVYDTTEET